MPDSASCSSPPALTLRPAEVKTLFSNVAAILAVNTMLLESLAARITSWTSTTKLGDLFVSMARRCLRPLPLGTSCSRVLFFCLSDRLFLLVISYE